MSTPGRRPGGRPRCSGESGSASLLVALGCVLLTVAAAAAAALGSVLVVRNRVAAAADLGSLAAASATLEAEGEACARARAVVRSNGATMTRCRVTGSGAWVEVVGAAPPGVAWLTGGRTAQLRARAHAELVPAGGVGAMHDPWRIRAFGGARPVRGPRCGGPHGARSGAAV